MGEKAYYRDDECDDRDDTYDLLRGPNGFECLLTEPEDRTWRRDGAEVVAELNRLHAALARVRGQRDAAALLVRNMWRGSDLCANSEVRANVDLEPIGIRVIGGTVEEIES